MSEVGFVAFVEGGELGSQTSVAALSGDTVILVTDASDFLDLDETAGGLLDIGQAGLPLAFTAAVLNDDLTTGTITLAVALDADVAEGVRVDLWVTSGPVVAYTAGVLYAGIAEPVDAVIPHHLVTHLPQGPRAEGQAEQVALSLVDGALTITDVLSKTPAVDGGYLDGGLPITPGAMIESYRQHPTDHAGSVPGEAQGSGIVSADLNHVGRFQAGPFVANTLGARVTTAAGATRTMYNPDASTFHGSDYVDTDHLQAREGTLAGSFKGAAGGSLTLGDTGLLLSPQQPPVTAYDWITVALNLGEGVAANRKSLGMKSATVGFTTITNRNNLQQTRIIQFSTTGAFSTSVLPVTGSPTPATIVSADYSSLADNIQTLEFDPAAAQWLVRYYSWSTLAYSHQWVVAQLGSVLNPLPAVCSYSSGGHEFTRICRSNPDGTVAINRYDNEVYVATTTTLDAFNFGDLEATGALGSLIVLTGTTNIIADVSTVGGFYVGQPVLPVVNINFSGAPGATLGYLLVENGDLAAAGIASIDSDTTQFRTWYLSGGNNVLAQQSNALEAGAYWTFVSYVDSVGGHETAFDSALAVLQTKVPGCQVTYTVAPPPPGSAANKMRVYLAKDAGAGVPARTSFFPNATSNATEWHASVFTVLTSGTNPLATGTIPSGAAFAIKDALGNVLIDGSGGGVLSGFDGGTW